MVNFMGVAAGIGDVVSKSIKEEQKRIDLLTDKALDFHTKEYYRLKEKRSDKLERTESLIGELASRFGDDARAVERAAFYVNQNGIDGTRQLMKTFDDERASGNRLDAKDFFKYVNTDPDAPLKTKLEYAQGIVAPIQLGEPEFLTGVKSDRGIASLFTGDPKETLQRGFEERKAMGLYGKETERPDLQFGAGGADMSLIRGPMMKPLQQFNRASSNVLDFENKNAEAIKNKTLSTEQQQTYDNLLDARSRATDLYKRQEAMKFETTIYTSPDALIAGSSQRMVFAENAFGKNSDEYKLAAKLYKQGIQTKKEIEKIENSTKTTGNIPAGTIISKFKEYDKKVTSQVFFKGVESPERINPQVLSKVSGVDINAIKIMSNDEKMNLVAKVREGEAMKVARAYLPRANKSGIQAIISNSELMGHSGVLRFVNEAQGSVSVDTIAPPPKSNLLADTNKGAGTDTGKVKGRKIKLNKQNVNRVYTNTKSANVPENKIDDTVVELFKQQGHSETKAKQLLKEVKEDRKKLATLDQIPTTPTSSPLPTSSYDRSVERYNRTLKGKREVQKREAEARRQGRRGLMSSPVT